MLAMVLICQHARRLEEQLTSDRVELGVLSLMEILMRWVMNQRERESGRKRN